MAGPYVLTKVASADEIMSCFGNADGDVDAADSRVNGLMADLLLLLTEKASAPKRDTAMMRRMAVKDFMVVVYWYVGIDWYVLT
mmetsp:Transcript_25027/g.37016  ORF Transcript_25027/g.37016 Transcript_25027/m.37016 type:complete len:84 (+) Transcript_25027:605-856(+)